MVTYTFIVVNRLKDSTYVNFISSAFNSEHCHGVGLVES